MTRNLVLIAAVAAWLAGCSGESSLPTPTGKGSIRTINAIPTSPAIAFLIESRGISAVEYKSSSPTVQYDDFEYNFNFEIQAAGTTQTSRIASRALKVETDGDYTFVLSGNLNAPTVTLWEHDVRTFGANDNLFEVRFGHTAGSLGPVDVYYAAPGVTPALGQQAATLSFGEIAEAADFPGGDYVLTYTPAGDPATVLFQSSTQTPELRTASIITVFDADANDVAPIAVRRIGAGGGGSGITSPDYPPTFRFIHASATTGPTDVYVEEAQATLTTPDISGHAFGNFSGDLPALAGANYLTYTSPGDTSVIIHSATQNTVAGVHYELYLLGTSSLLAVLPTIPERRPVSTAARFSIINTAYEHPFVNVFIVEADASVENAAPIFFRLALGDSPGRTGLQPGSYDLYVEEPDADRTVLAGPLRIDLSGGDILQLLVLDNIGQPEIVDLVELPLP